VNSLIGCGVPEKFGSVIAILVGTGDVFSLSLSGVFGDCMAPAFSLAHIEMANGFFQKLMVLFLLVSAKD
jgi:hypothetical protein